MKPKLNDRNLELLSEPEWCTEISAAELVSRISGLRAFFVECMKVVLEEKLRLNFSFRSLSFFFFFFNHTDLLEVAIFQEFVRLVEPIDILLVLLAF